ncbi:MAG: hypothetical protein WD595_03915 [Waddliaceae bacterium]
MTVSTYIPSIRELLLQGRSFDIKPVGPRPLSILERAFEYIQGKKRERLTNVATVLTKALLEAKFDSVSSALSSEIVKTSRLFQKTLKKEGFIALEFEKALKAKKLAIDPTYFDTNPGFHEYATASALEQYLLHYGDQLECKGDDILIRKDNEMTPWSEIQDSIALSSPSKHLPTPTSLYGPSGVECKDRYDWKELTPYKHEDPSQWDYQYVFEACVCCSEKAFRLSGDHSWIRLKTPEGEIYSVGLYRKGKNGTQDLLKTPLQMKEGFLQSPDVSEAWPMPIHRMGFPITEEQFWKIKGSIERDKQTGLAFDSVETNCTRYTADKLAIADIHLPISAPIWKLIFPKRVISLIDLSAKWIPEVFKKVVRVTGAVVLNMVLVTLGAFYTCKEVRHLQQKPKIGSIFDIFKPSIATVHAPTYLAQVVFKEIQKWRDENNQPWGIPGLLMIESAEASPSEED